MSTVSNLDPAARDRLTGRLKRTAVLDQIASIKVAINGLSSEVAETCELHRLSHPDQLDSPDEPVRQMVRTMIRAGR